MRTCFPAGGTADGGATSVTTPPQAVPVAPPIRLTPGVAAPAPAPGSAPQKMPFHVLAKPTGAICNLDCTYCFFLSKEELYPGDRFRMPDDLLELYLTQLLESEPDGDVTVAWQGGEPTLMGVEFFRRVVETAERLRRPTQHLHHTIQTNGTLLTDEWATLLAEHRFLVGVSIDGPPDLHDRYRVDKHGRPSSERVLRGLELLQRHGVDVNILCTVHAGNQDHPLEVYRYFRDDLGVGFIQFIPIVERIESARDAAEQAVAREAAEQAATSAGTNGMHGPDGPGSGAPVTDRSVDPEAWGRFLTTVFDEWFRNDMGDVFVQLFDASLAAWCAIPSPMCIFSETCGRGLALEHNGDVYSCDHFVEPEHLLGNIRTTHLADLVSSPAQRAFGQAKADSLPQMCRACDFRFACHGECPKNRIITTPDGEAGLNYLCAGYLAFWKHVDGPMRLMARLLAAGRPATDVAAVIAAAGRNDPCPCGSGRKAKLCHQR